MDRAMLLDTLRENRTLFERVMSQVSETRLMEPVGNDQFSDNTLLLRMPRQEREIPSIAVDNRRFSYEDFGLITFNIADDGTVPSLEWWTRTFTCVLQ